jgi:hypothetical protein
MSIRRSRPTAQECPSYEPHREILCTFSPQLRVADIIGTYDDIIALAKFNERTGAFTKSGTRTTAEDAAYRLFVPDPPL